MSPYTTREAAATLGVSVRRVQQAAKHYDLGRWFGRQRMLTDSDLAVIRSRLGMAGYSLKPKQE
jgi:hypothetical protein